jgi:proline iminopeptidase
MTTFFILSGCSSNADEGYIPVKDGKIFYKAFGSGTPVLVLHGGPGLDHAYLLPQLQELAKDHRVIFYDQRGSGKSLDTPLDAEHINITQFTDDVEAVRKELKIDHFALIGHSWGGLLAMSYAVKYPDHLSQLILVTPAPASVSGQEGFMKEFTKRTQSIAKEIAPLFDGEAFKKLNATEISDLYRNTFRVYFYNPGDVDALTLQFNVPSARSGFKVNELMLKSCWLHKGCAILPQLSSIKTPTLMIYGTGDLVPVSSGNEINKAIFGSHIIFIKECGHFPYIEKPDELFGAIREFLKDSNTF